MKHIKLFEDLGKEPERLILYLYNYTYEYDDNHHDYYMAFLAPNDDFMSEMIQDLVDDETADFEGSEGEYRDSPSYSLIESIQMSESDLKKAGIDYGNRFKILISHPGLGYYDIPEDERFVINHSIDIDKKTHKFLTFDAKEEAEKYSKLTDSMIDDLCKELMKYHSWDNSKAFGDIKK